MAAADRIKILLELVDEDDFLHEILSTANRMVEGSEVVQSPLPACPTGDAPQRIRTPVLDKSYHEAKKKSLESHDIARIRLI